jgi:hypothetical protein
MDQDEMVFRLVLLLVVIVWSIWNAVLARRRGRGPIRWLLASLVISPMLVTIVLALLGRPRQPTQEQFPHEQSTTWSQDFEQRRRWYEALERTGPENVRAILAQTNAGSGGSIAIGTEISLTIGFAQEWLAWHDRQKTEREAKFRRNQIFWTRWAALAATLAALAAAFGWGLATWSKW